MEEIETRKTWWCELSSWPLFHMCEDRCSLGRVYYQTTDSWSVRQFLQGTNPFECTFSSQGHGSGTARQMNNGVFTLLNDPLCTHIHTHTHTFNSPFFQDYPGEPGTKKGKTNLDFTEARDSEWQRHHLGHMQVCISLQTDNHASTPPLSFYRPDALPAAQPTASKHWRHYVGGYNNRSVAYSRRFPRRPCHSPCWTAECQWRS